MRGRPCSRAKIWLKHWCLEDGARGTRTPDLLGAIQAAASPELAYIRGFPGCGGAAEVRLSGRFPPISARDRAKEHALWPDLTSRSWRVACPTGSAGLVPSPAGRPDPCS